VALLRAENVFAGCIRREAAPTLKSAMTSNDDAAFADWVNPSQGTLTKYLCSRVAFLLGSRIQPETNGAY
jgi:hypothetical protein